MTVIVLVSNDRCVFLHFYPTTSEHMYKLYKKTSGRNDRVYFVKVV